MEILNQKDKLISQAQERIALFFQEQGNKFANDLLRIVGKGIFDAKIIEEQMTALGYDAKIIEELGTFDELFNLSKNMFKVGEIPFLWTAENETIFGEFVKIKGMKLINSFKEQFALDMADYAMSARLSGKPIAQIKSEVAERMAQEGRRLGTEVNTALSTFDRTTEKMLYENAGIQKYIYWGPVDSENRPSCERALSDPHQTTGWTMADIEADPELDFDLGGYPYYNCRHKFIPMEFDAAKVMEAKVGS